MAGAESDRSNSTTSESGTLPTRRRAFKPKVKTGCLRCKRRRVKCDEQKPICGACKRNSLACTYPVELPPPTNRRGDGWRPIVPVAAAEAANIPSLLALWPEKSGGHEAALNYDAYLHYFSRSGPTLGSMVFWARAVPRESSSDECVRYAMLAIGSLCRVLSERSRRASYVPLFHTTSCPGTTTSPAYQQALQYYTRALSKFGKNQLLHQLQKHEQGASHGKHLIQQQPSPRTILIRTILFSAFEIMQGNAEGAGQLMVKGISVLHDKLSAAMHVAFTNPTQHGGIAARLDDDAIEEAQYLLLRMAAYRGLCSTEYTAIGQVLPSLHLRRVVPEPPRPHEADIGKVFTLWERFMTTSVVWIYSVTSHLFRYSAAGLGPSLYVLESRPLALIPQLRAWERCLNSISEQARGTPAQRIALRLCLFYCKISAIFVTCEEDPTDTAWDAHSDEIMQTFQFLVDLLDEGYTPSWHDLSFDSRLLVMVQMSVQRTRDPDLRGFFSRLSRRLAYMRMDSDFKVLAISGDAVYSLEKQGADKATDYIPISSRYRTTQGIQRGAGRWNADYTEFQFSAFSVLPRENGLHDEVLLSVRPPAN